MKYGFKALSVAAIAALSLAGLAGCSDSKDEEATSPASEVTSQVTETAPSVKSTTTSKAKTTSATQSPTPIEKPSKDEVKRGFRKIVDSDFQLGYLSAAQKEQFTTCVVDKVYDRLWSEALGVMADGDAHTKIPGRDSLILSGAMQECITELGL